MNELTAEPHLTTHAEDSLHDDTHSLVREMRPQRTGERMQEDILNPQQDKLVADRVAGLELAVGRSFAELLQSGQQRRRVRMKQV